MPNAQFTAIPVDRLSPPEDETAFASEVYAYFLRAGGHFSTLFLQLLLSNGETITCVVANL